MNLKQITEKYNTQAKCLSFLAKERWGKAVTCSYCGSDRVIKAKNEEGRYHCYNCKRSFSVLVGTIFQDTKLSLPDWFWVIGLILTSPTGISAMSISRKTGMSLKTSWLTAMKIRCAMIDKDTQLHGVLEMDESYFSAKDGKLPAGEPSKPVISNVTEKRGRGTKKVPVVGIVEKSGHVKTKIIEKLTTRNLMAMLNHSVNTEDSVLITDGFRSYNQMDEAIEHITVRHKDRKAGAANVNTIEGYWGLIKNGIRGNFKSLSKKYLPFYLVEYEYKYNRRKDTPKQLFDEFIHAALTDESCMLNNKPTKDTKEVVYGW